MGTHFSAVCCISKESLKELKSIRSTEFCADLVVVVEWVDVVLVDDELEEAANSVDQHGLELSRLEVSLRVAGQLHVPVHRQSATSTGVQQVRNFRSSSDL